MHWRDIKKEKPEWGEKVLGYFPENEIKPFSFISEPDQEMSHWMRLEKPKEITLNSNCQESGHIWIPIVGENRIFDFQCCRCGKIKDLP